MQNVKTKSENELLAPSLALISDMQRLEGDIILLGVAGKMGPSMAQLARKASDKAGVKRRIIGVSRFSEPGAQARLEDLGVETVVADLLNEEHLAALPDAPNVLYLAGTKFGTTGNVAFSTGNVYPFMPIAEGGAAEDHPADPVGEYGQSCLGRERIFQHFSMKYGIPTLIYRLNYAIDFRYGVLLEIAKSVVEAKPIDLATGFVNVIWQGDANEIALRAFHHCEVPAKILNVTGPETIPVKWLAEQFGQHFGKTPKFINEVGSTALLSNASQAHRIFGYPRVTLRQMIELTADWVQRGGETLNKPTHFQERQGKF